MGLSVGFLLCILNYCDYNMMINDNHLRIWNMLPASLRLVDDCARFKRLLKAYLIDAAELSLFSCAMYKSLIYLQLVQTSRQLDAGNVNDRLETTSSERQRISVRTCTQHLCTTSSRDTCPMKQSSSSSLVIYIVRRLQN